MVLILFLVSFNPCCSGSCSESYRYCAAHKKDFIKNFYDDYMRELQLEKNREYNAKLFQSTLNQKPSKKKEKQTEIPSWFK